MNHPNDDAIDKLLRTQFDGPVPDDGFSERVMQHLPARRRRIAWPLWAGVLAGIGACWLSLLPSPLLQAGWRDWAGGELSAASVILLLAFAGMSLMALCWSVAEADDH
jgi:hypothetical protein